MKQFPSLEGILELTKSESYFEALSDNYGLKIEVVEFLEDTHFEERRRKAGRSQCFVNYFTALS